jgi:SAM-dependent methyltransferase
VPVVDAAVPPSGDVIEVGCGHGLVSLTLAMRSAHRRVTGVDIDAAKIEQARAAAARQAGGAARACFASVEPGYLPGPERSWDAVVLVDVLYLLPEEEQRRLLCSAARSLRPGGVVVVKEMGLEPRWKLSWNRFQETLATRVFGVTKSVGAGLTFVAPEVYAEWLGDEGLEVTTRRIDGGYPWPHRLVVGRKPEAQG